MVFTLPPRDCVLCPRLAAFREANRKQFPSFFNAPVPSFGELTAQVLVVGLAPGLKGANQTGRPFTGDYAGIILYSALQQYGFAAGKYKQKANDGLKLINCRITNAVRCVPQQNKPEPTEIRQCNSFLKNEIIAMPHLKAILSLGLVSHKAVLMGLGFRQSAYAFGHGKTHVLPRGNASPDSAPPNLPREVFAKHSSTTTAPLLLFNSYHCSRYNINTGTLTQQMFDEVVGKVKASLR